jgi:dihydropteroate synthase
VFGSSRKSFIGKLTGAEVGERLGGTIASNVIAYANGADVLRVHDVGPMRQALTVAEAILDPDRAAAISDRA